MSQAKRLKELEKQNQRLRQMFAAQFAGLPNKVDLEREIAAAAGEPAPTKPALPPRFTRKSTGWK